MRVMVIVKASKESEAGAMPSQEMLAAMGTYNEELVKAGSCWAARDWRRARREGASASRAGSGR